MNKALVTQLTNHLTKMIDNVESSALSIDKKLKLYDVIIGLNSHILTILEDSPDES